MATNGDIKLVIIFMMALRWCRHIVMGDFHKPVVYDWKLLLQLHLPDMNGHDVITEGKTAWSHCFF